MAACFPSGAREFSKSFRVTFSTSGDYNRLLPVTYAVALAFVGLTLFIMGADIVNPISLDS